MTGPAAWDRRYSAAEQVWSAEPSRWVVRAMAGRPPGRALDLGTGEGRHAVWLARAGWTVTAVDFSAQAVRKAAELQRAGAADTVGAVTWVHADIVAEPPQPEGYDAVLAVYLHLPASQRRTVLRRAAEALAPGGLLLVVGHDRTNLTEGVSGPRDPAVLFTAGDVVADLAGLPVSVRRAERAGRPVGEAVAVDAVVEAVRT